MCNTGARMATRTHVRVEEKIMSWMDFDDVRKLRGTRIKKWPEYHDGKKLVIDARLAEKKHKRQIEAEKERAEKMALARRRKAEQDRLKAEKKAEDKASKKVKKGKR